MNEMIRFTTEKLSGLLHELSHVFLTPEDFPHVDRREEIGLICRKITLSPNNHQPSFIASLTGREMENLVLALFQSGEDQRSPEESEALIRVLSFRMSDRLIRIIWQLYQTNYKNNNPNVPRMLELVAEATRQKDEPIPEAALLTVLSQQGGKDQVVEMLNNYSQPINSFLKEYHFNKKSPLVWSIVKRFLEQCDKEFFPFNEGWVQRTIQYNDVVSLNRLLVNYLEKLPVDEYLEEVNLRILDKMGYPYSSEEWRDVPESLKRKFSNWNSSRLLAIHLQGKHNSKYRLLSSYLPEIREIFPMREGELLILDFDKFIIADEVGVPNYSYLILPDRFRQIRDSLEEISIKTFATEGRDFPEAREFILEEAESNILQLNYRDVGKLYIKKTLDILLGKEMDMRYSKSILKKVRVSLKENRT